MRVGRVKFLKTEGGRGGSNRSKFAGDLFIVASGLSRFVWTVFDRFVLAVLVEFAFLVAAASWSALREADTHGRRSSFKSFRCRGCLDSN